MRLRFSDGGVMVGRSAEIPGFALASDAWSDRLWRDTFHARYGAVFLLSCIAAFQAPIIMMAHNRLAKRERLRADEDYYTNLKAELEIRQLHDKLDKFLKNLPK